MLAGKCRGRNERKRQFVLVDPPLALIDKAEISNLSSIGFIHVENFCFSNFQRHSDLMISARSSPLHETLTPFSTSPTRRRLASPSPSST
jgi:hypothetical protein